MGNHFHYHHQWRTKIRFSVVITVEFGVRRIGSTQIKNVSTRFDFFEELDEESVPVNQALNLLLVFTIDGKYRHIIALVTRTHHFQGQRHVHRETNVLAGKLLDKHTPRERVFEGFCKSNIARKHSN
jgi:adenylate cyclase